MPIYAAEQYLILWFVLAYTEEICDSDWDAEQAQAEVSRND